MKTEEEIKKKKEFIERLLNEYNIQQELSIGTLQIKKLRVRLALLNWVLDEEIKVKNNTTINTKDVTTAIKPRILVFLEDNKDKSYSCNDISDIFNISQQSIQKYMRELRREELVVAHISYTGGRPLVYKFKGDSNKNETNN